MNERFVSNMTGDIIFSTRSLERLIRQTYHKRLADACQNTEIFLEVKHNYCKCAQRTIETLINNYLVKERAFLITVLNEQFESKTTRDKIFTTRCSERFRQINISQATCWHVWNRTFPWSKNITKHKRRIIKTLINKFFVKKRAYYRLNEWSMSNISGDISFQIRWWNFDLFWSTSWKYLWVVL